VLTNAISLTGSRAHGRAPWPSRQGAKVSPTRTKTGRNHLN
jgi:hypothetical protein